MKPSGKLGRLAQRDTYPSSLILRLASLGLAASSLIAAGVSFVLYVHVFTDGEGQVWAAILILPGAFMFFWTLLYLILLSCHVAVPYPVTIGFELWNWLLGFGFAGMGPALTSWPGHGSGCQPITTDPYHDECYWGPRITATMVLAYLFLSVAS